MARQEQDREDLLAEATALVQRCELRVPPWPEPLVLGIRRDGALSIYFGAEPAYHFNAAGELRRAYWHGRLIKAEARQLVSLNRQRTAAAVELLRHELSPAETHGFLVELEEQIAQLRSALANHQAQALRCVPPDQPLLAAAATWLAALPSPIVVAQRPHVGH